MKIGKYEILSELAHGGMGVIYKARDPFIDRIVALKALRPSKDVSDELKRRLVVEARAAGSLHHPNIVTVHDLGIRDGLPYIVMELLEGMDLAQVIRKHPRVLLANKLTLLATVADALDFAHRRNVIHRDIKPSNIYLCSDGQVKVVDFGIARVSEVTLTSTGQIMGTIAYMAPEQLKGSTVDRRADIFSFGVLAYELLGGRRPFESDQPAAIVYRIINEEPAACPGLPAGLATELNFVLGRALKKTPAERYQHMADLASDLREVARTRAGVIAEADASTRAGIEARIASARSLVAERKMDESVAAIRGAIDVDPTHRETVLLAERIEEDRFRDQVRAELARIQELVRQSSDLQSARHALKSILRRDSSLVDARKLLKQVEERLREAGRLDPGTGLLTRLREPAEATPSMAEPRAEEPTRLLQHETEPPAAPLAATSARPATTARPATDTPAAQPKPPGGYRPRLTPQAPAPASRPSRPAPAAKRAKRAKRRAPAARPAPARRSWLPLVLATAIISGLVSAGGLWLALGRPELVELTTLLPALAPATGDAIDNVRAAVVPADRLDEHTFDPTEEPAPSRPDVRPEPTPVATTEPTPVATPRPTPVATPQPTPIATPQPTPVATPRATPEPRPTRAVIPTPAPVMVDVAPQLARARRAGASADWQAVEAALDEAARRASDDPRTADWRAWIQALALLRKADAESASGSYRAARATYLEAEASLSGRDDFGLSTHLRRGSSLAAAEQALSEKRFSAARAAFASAGDNDGERRVRVAELHADGALALERDRLRDAAQSYAELVRLDPGDAEARAQLALINAELDAKLGDERTRLLRAELGRLRADADAALDAGAYARAAALYSELDTKAPGTSDAGHRARLASALDEAHAALERGDCAAATASLRPFKSDARARELLGRCEALDRHRQAAVLRDMVAIPAGSFRMGDKGLPEMEPPHKVTLSAFHIDRYKVTNGEYARFVASTGRRPPPSWSGGQASRERLDHPVTHVTWDDANAYCAWAGKRLPDEREWERAARGPKERDYPWGNGHDSDRYNSGGRTTPVQAYARHASGFGVVGLVDYVWEWTSSWFAPYPGGRRDDPRYGQRLRVVRGRLATRGDDPLSVACRHALAPSTIDEHMGFRCAIAADELARLPR